MVFTRLSMIHFQLFGYYQIVTVIKLIVRSQGSPDTPSLLTGGPAVRLNQVQYLLTLGPVLLADCGVPTRGSWTPFLIAQRSPIVPGTSYHVLKCIDRKRPQVLVRPYRRKFRCEQISMGILSAPAEDPLPLVPWLRRTAVSSGESADS